MEQTEASKDSRIVVVELNMAGKTLMFGVMTDSVHDVIEIEPHQIERPPAVGARLKTGSIKGIGKRDDQFILIIDINKIFGSEALPEFSDSEDWNTTEQNAAAA